MDKEFDCRFFFGDRLYKNSNIRKVDYTLFKKEPIELKRYTLSGNFYYLSGFLSLLNKPFQYYLITGEHYCISNWLLLIAARLLRKKVFIWGHGLYGNEKGIILMVKKLFIKFASGIFVYGKRSKELLVNSGISEDKIDIIYNSLDYENQLIFRKNLQHSNVFNKHFGEVCPTLLFIGRLGKSKQLDLFILLISKLRSTGVPVNAIVIGEGIEKERLVKLTSDQKLENNVWFYGSCYNEETIGHLIFNADICISPGNVGLTTIHSLSFGTPIITHNNFSKQGPEYEAINKDKTGDFFEEGNLNDLVKTTREWIKKYPQKPEKLITECYTVIDQFYNPYYQINILKKKFV